MAGACGADSQANDLLISLKGDKDFSLPDVNLNDNTFQIPDGNGDLSKPPVALRNEDLTTRDINGTGTFDVLMGAINSHLVKEYEKNRITGQDYTKAYTGALEGALATAVQFLLGKDQAHWQAILAQQQARRAEIEVVTARVQLETAKAALRVTQYQAQTAEAEYALVKMRLATEDANYCMILAQTTNVREQTKLVTSQTAASEYNTQNILPANLAGIIADNATKTYTNTNLLPKQRDLLQEQIEVQRSQTLNNRSDGALISGSVGKQKELWSQQITSYERDAETKVSKMFVDAWITMKTMDEGLLPPNNFVNSQLDRLLDVLRIKNNLT